MLTVSDLAAKAEARAAEYAVRLHTRTALKDACRAHGITQDRIAARAKVTRPAVVRWFGGHFDSQRIAGAVKTLLSRTKAS